jgi:hypothetical protein
LDNSEVTILYTLDPTKIQSSDVWFQEENDQFFVANGRYMYAALVLGALAAIASLLLACWFSLVLVKKGKTKREDSDISR